MRFWHQRSPGGLCGQNTGCRLQTLHGGTSVYPSELTKPLWRWRCCDSVWVIPFSAGRGRQAVRQKHEPDLISFPFQPERINPDLSQKGYSVKSDIWSLGITMVSHLRSRGFCECGSDTRRPCLPDRAGHFEVPLRVVGHAVPAAQAGSGRAIPAAARRPILARVCRLHLQMVSPAPAWATVLPPSRFCRWPSRGQRWPSLVPATLVPAHF